MTAPRATVVVPAHDEERVIGRLLDQLRAGDGGELEVLVVCNGCSDRTAEVARAHGARVIEIDEPSKRTALRVGDDAAAGRARVYVDADVEIGRDDVLHMIDRLDGGEALAVAPRRDLPRDGVAWPVRWYYDVWEQLPQVRTGLFGRGVVALSETGNDRVRALPPVMSDDLVMSEAFAESERLVDDGAQVTVHIPRTTRDLYRRRVRVVTGNRQADDEELRSSGSSTSLSILGRLARDEPGLIPRIPVFVAFAVASKLGARRAIRSGDHDTWLRDESSRS